MDEAHVRFECPNCTHILDVNMKTVYELMDHVYDHVLDCPECFNEAVDKIFSNFVLDGFAPNSSAIRQCLKYFDMFLVNKWEVLRDEDAHNIDSGDDSEGTG